MKIFSIIITVKQKLLQHDDLIQGYTIDGQMFELIMVKMPQSLKGNDCQKRKQTEIPPYTVCKSN